MPLMVTAKQGCVQLKNPTSTRSSSLLGIFPHSCVRRHAVNVTAQVSGADSGTGRDKRGSMKGKNFTNTSRRKGRDAHLRSPYDTPLRDGNRDRLIGLLTERAAKTLMVYLMETNVLLHNWLVLFYKENPIPRIGSWDEVSGDSFLRKLLAMPVSSAKLELGRDPLFDNSADGGVDPRSMAQRIMEIRSQLSTEFVQDLKAVAEENSALLRESLLVSLATLSFDEDDSSASNTSSATAPTSTSSSSSSSSLPAATSTAAGTTLFAPTIMQPPLPYKRVGERGRSGRQAPESSPTFEANRTPGPPPADASRKKPPLAFASKAPLKNWRFTAMHSFASTSFDEIGSEGSSKTSPAADIKHYQPPAPSSAQQSPNAPPAQPLYMRLMGELSDEAREGKDVDLNALAETASSSSISAVSSSTSAATALSAATPTAPNVKAITDATASVSSSSSSESTGSSTAPRASSEGEDQRVIASSVASAATTAAAAAAAATRLAAEAVAAATAAEVAKQMQAYLATVHPEIAEMIRDNVEGWQQQFPDIAAVLAQESAAATATASARFALKNLMNNSSSGENVSTGVVSSADGGGRGVFEGGRNAVDGPLGTSVKSDIGGGGGEDEEGWLQQRESSEGQGQ